MSPSVESVVAAIERRGQAQGLESLAPHERRLFVAWRGTVTITGGGLRRFYREGGDIDSLAAAYRALGLPKCADACLGSKALFPRGHPFDRPEQTVAFLERHYPAIAEALGDCTGPIFMLGLQLEGLASATEKYLKAARRAAAER